MGRAVRSTRLVDELSFPVSCPVSRGCGGTSPTAYPEVQQTVMMNHQTVFD
jgi:hypothetical protein